MRRLVIALAAGTLMSGAAVAADMPVKGPMVAPAPAYNWTGCYLGATAGIGVVKTGGYNATPTTLAGGTPLTGRVYANDVNFNGFAGGLLGCNYQISNQWVIGAEGEYDWLQVKNTGSSVNGVLVNDATGETRIRSLAMARARLGTLVWNNSTLLFVSGGAAWMNIRDVQYVASNIAGTFNSQSATRSGWTAGLGAEFHVTGNWLIRAEYMYVEIPRYTTFTNPPFTANPPAPLTQSIIDHLGRVAISYKFF